MPHVRNSDVWTFAGLGSRAGRSLQRQFDEAVACLRAVHEALLITIADLAAEQPHAVSDVSTSSGHNLCAVEAVGTPSTVRRQGNSNTISTPASELARAVASKLSEWEAVVSSHQSASRILKWSAPQ